MSISSSRSKISNINESADDSTEIDNDTVSEYVSVKTKEETDKNGSRESEKSDEGTQDYLETPKFDGFDTDVTDESGSLSDPFLSLQNKHKSTKHLSPEERAAKLKRWRERNVDRMNRETPAEKKAREKRNHKNRLKRANETPEQRNKRLKKLREYQQIRIRNETSEERERRLKKMKEYSRRSKNTSPNKRLSKTKMVLKSELTGKESSEQNTAEDESSGNRSDSNEEEVD